MRKGTWGAIAAATGGVISTLVAVWPGALLEGGEQEPALNPVVWFSAHLIAGALGIAALFVVARYVALSRAMLLLAAAVLVGMLILEPFSILNFMTGVIPAVLMLAAAFTIAPPPTVVEE